MVEMLKLVMRVSGSGENWNPKSCFASLRFKAGNRNVVTSRRLAIDNFYAKGKKARMFLLYFRRSISFR